MDQIRNFLEISCRKSKLKGGKFQGKNGNSGILSLLDDRALTWYSSRARKQLFERLAQMTSLLIWSALLIFCINFCSFNAPYIFLQIKTLVSGVVSHTTITTISTLLFGCSIVLIFILRVWRVFPEIFHLMTKCVAKCACESIASIIPRFVGANVPSSNSIHFNFWLYIVADFIYLVVVNNSTRFIPICRCSLLFLLSSFYLESSCFDEIQCCQFLLFVHYNLSDCSPECGNNVETSHLTENLLGGSPLELQCQFCSHVGVQSFPCGYCLWSVG